MARLGSSQSFLRMLPVDQRKPHSLLKNLLYILLAICIIILILSYVALSTSKVTTKHELYEEFKGESVDLRRDAARDLKRALQDLRRAKDYNQPPMAHTLLALQRILTRLDPRLVSVDGRDSSSREKLLEVDNQTKVWGGHGLLEACPEQYRGQDIDDPYYNMAFIADCPNKIPLKDLVTIVIDATNYKDLLLDILLQDIVSRYRGMPILVGLTSKNNQRVVKKYDEANIVRVTSSTPPSVRWNRLIAQVTTKYVLIGYNLTALSRYTNIERLVRAYRQVPHAAYVSGATRNETGHWTLECYQTRLELYGLSLREGYTNSIEECMYCDAVNGPFLTEARMFSSIPLDDHLPEAVVFADWFLRIRANDGLGLSCPDVLFFVGGYLKKSFTDHKSWQFMSVKWGVTDIYLPGRIIHHFSCDETHLKCTGLADYLASPPCCVARLSRALREAVAAFDRAAVNVHISESTVVGAVKGGLQPWEPYVHLTSYDAPEDIQNAIDELRRSGFVVDPHSSGKRDKLTYSLRAHSHVITLHLFPVDMRGNLPASERETPTRIHIGNGWVPTPPNPGLYARGFQGRGSLKHRPLQGTWPHCDDPGHHACLDHLPLDGSWARLR